MAFFTPLLLFVCFENALYILWNLNDKKKRLKRFVEDWDIVGLCVGIHCYFTHFDAHKLSFFSTWWQTHWESSVTIYSIWDNKAYVCVFVSVFSALIKPWNRIEIGVLLELSSYLDCVWCDFCTWENSRLKCLPFVSNVITESRLILRNPLRQPMNFTILFGQQWFVLYATYFKSRRWHPAMLSEPCWWNYGEF